MYNIKNLNIYLEKDLRWLIKDFNLSFTKDDKVAIIGEEGNGKSTLFKVITNRKSVEKYASVSCEILFSDLKIGYLSQEVEKENLEKYTFDYFYDKVGDDFDYNTLYTLLTKFELEDYFFEKNVKIQSLSGGERVKYLLLCLLLNEPEIMLLDEPSNNLDTDALEWLEDFIKASKLPILFITHDATLAANCSTMIVHFEQLKRKKEFSYRVERLDYREYLEKRQDEWIQSEKKAKKEQQLFKEKEQRHREIYHKVRTAMNQEVRNPKAAKNLKDKMRSLKSQEKRLEKEKNNLLQKQDYEEQILLKFPKLEVVKGKNILNLTISDLSIEEKNLLTNSHFEVKSGEKVFITGKNGSGKTTLLKSLIEKLYASNINFGYMPQDYETIFEKYKTPLDFLEDGDVPTSQIYTYLGSVNFLFEEMKHDIGNLSGGQKAKLYLTKLILNNNEILLLDEPTRNLSIMSTKALIRELKNFEGSIVAISHDRTFVEEVATKVYKIENKKLKLIL